MNRGITGKSGEMRSVLLGTVEELVRSKGQESWHYKILVKHSNSVWWPLWGYAWLLQGGVRSMSWEMASPKISLFSAAKGPQDGGVSMHCKKLDSRKSKCIYCCETTATISFKNCDKQSTFVFYAYITFIYLKQDDRIIYLSEMAIVINKVSTS